STGPDAYNQSLSQRRADAVAQSLIANGVQPVRVVAVGFGEARPIADNNTVAGRQANRRVEIKLVGVTS
ncbi:MAG: oprF, partial [Alphaproteobacteria bacterium]